MRLTNAFSIYIYKPRPHNIPDETKKSVLLPSLLSDKFFLSHTHATSSSEDRTGTSREQAKNI